MFAKRRGYVDAFDVALGSRLQIRARTERIARAGENHDFAFVFG